jgi:hypothetical protein
MISKKVFFWSIYIIIILGFFMIIKTKLFPAIYKESFVNSSCAIFLDGTYIWLADYQQYVQQFDMSGKLINKFPAGYMPSSLIVNAGYIACTQVNGLSVIKISSAYANVVRVGTLPIACTYDGSNMWIANRNSDNFSVVDTVMWKNNVTNNIGYGPVSTAFDGTYIWFALPNEGKVAVVNRSNYNVSKMPVGNAQNVPMKVCADPSQKFVLVLNSSSTIQKVNIYGVQDTIDIPEGVYGGIASDGKIIYVGDSSGMLRFFDINTGKVTIGPIAFGESISDIAVDSTYVYVFSNSSGIFKSYNKNTGDLALTFNS